MTTEPGEVSSHSKKIAEPTLWIEPYVKGPKDKPLKAPMPEVYAVTR